MTVIIHREVDFGGRAEILPVYTPSRPLTKKEREQADRLDVFLEVEIPKKVSEITKNGSQIDNAIKFWYLLGRYLRDLFSKSDLISETDIEEGHIWSAVWQYIPKIVKPKGLVNINAFIEYKSRRRDYLSLGYEISLFDWDDVSWIKGIEDWYQLVSRPGILRDERILKCLKKEILSFDKYPSADTMREIAKGLGKEFPTKRLRDSTVLDDKTVKNVVHLTVNKIIDSPET